MTGALEQVIDTLVAEQRSRRRCRRPLKPRSRLCSFSRRPSGSIGGLVAIFVVARVAHATLGAAERVAFFRGLGRGVRLVGGIALVAALASGAVLASVPLLEHLPHLAARGAGDSRRPVGIRQLAGMGHQQPAAAAQLHVDTADPLRAACIRSALPACQDRPAAREAVTAEPCTG
jgi:hypothetical protein